MLALNNVEVVYDGVILVLKGVSLNAEEGHITTLLGANGAGKTTTLKAISGLLQTERGQVTKGSVLDEPSLGLAPVVIEEIFGVIRRLKDEQQLTVLLVEQNAALALDIADHGYVMENGRIVLEGPAEALRQNSDIKEFYLGLNEAGARKSYRDLKHYRRRKRWLF